MGLIWSRIFSPHNNRALRSGRGERPPFGHGARAKYREEVGMIFLRGPEDLAIPGKTMSGSWEH